MHRIAYFQELVKASSIPTYDAGDLSSITLDFIRRNDEALTEAKASRRAGRPPSKEETTLTQLIDTERQELKAGFWVPDLRDGDVVKMLKEWNGDWVALGQMKFVRVDDKGTVKDSQWPPNR